MPQHIAVKQAKDLNKAIIMAKPNVVGVGVGYKQSKGRMTGELSVVVLVKEKIPLAGLTSKALVPGKVSGISTDVVQVGEIRALQSRTDRWRPVPGGVSIGHYQVSAGTLGCVVRDRASGERLILSNNHVLANSNNGEQGDPILQPGPADGGQADEHTVAYLERFSPILFTDSPATCSMALSYAKIGNTIADLLGSSHRVQVAQSDPMASNVADAAVARPVNSDLFSNEILEVGELEGTTKPALGLAVRKSGRTTGLSSGEIIVLDAVVNVKYGYFSSATFENQIVTTAMSQGGDSGSLLVTSDSTKAVGLLFAGSDQSTIYNPIRTVMESLNLEIGSSTSTSKKADMQAAIERAQAVKHAYKDRLMAKPNVVGVGVGLQRVDGVRTENVALIVMVSKKVPRSQLASEDIIPNEIEGVPVDIKVVGEIKPQ